MVTDKPKEVFDLLLVVDATSSMSNYLDSLRISFPRIISISKLTNSFVSEFRMYLSRALFGLS